MKTLKLLVEERTGDAVVIAEQRNLLLPINLPEIKRYLVDAKGLNIL